MNIGEGFVGNRKTVDHLDKVLQKELLSHAYIFDGPESVGKTRLALAFAAQLLEDDLAGVMNNPDLIFIEPGVDKKEIIADDIRSLQKSLSLYPYKSKWKIAIIDKAHLMNTTAANSLLKILEEPNQTSILILVSSDFSRVLDTIKSRCSTIAFSVVNDSILMDEMLCGVKNADLILELSCGRPGLISDFISGKKNLESMQGFRNSFMRCEEQGFDRMAEAERLCSFDADYVVSVLDIFIILLRKKLLENMSEVGRNDLVGVIRRRIDIVSRTKNDICNSNANLRLAIENLYLNI